MEDDVDEFHPRSQEHPDDKPTRPLQKKSPWNNQRNCRKTKQSQRHPKRQHAFVPIQDVAVISHGITNPRETLLVRQQPRSGQGRYGIRQCGIRFGFRSDDGIIGNVRQFLSQFDLFFVLLVFFFQPIRIQFLVLPRLCLILVRTYFFRHSHRTTMDQNVPIITKRWTSLPRIRMIPSPKHIRDHDPSAKKEERRRQQSRILDDVHSPSECHRRMNRKSVHLPLPKDQGIQCIFDQPSDVSLLRQNFVNVRSKEAHFEDVPVVRSIDAIFGDAMTLPLRGADPLFVGSGFPQ
mmetsp:Transcript_26094/g.53580  ORF Transcript_26094/g.53580 Transcript_26094/m.53580 type:complete len:292 (-) Transcript_26094:2008-2883(-)